MTLIRFQQTFYSIYIITNTERNSLLRIHSYWNLFGICGIWMVSAEDGAFEEFGAVAVASIKFQLEMQICEDAPYRLYICTYCAHWPSVANAFIQPDQMDSHRNKC